MFLVDRYVIAVMVFSTCVILFRSGMIYQRKESMTRNRKLFELLYLVPYTAAVAVGIILFLTGEVMV